MQTYIILLRGVMPTGKNRVPMAELRTALAKAGLADVQTYIQSGNVIARSSRDRPHVEQLVHDVIARDIGADIAVIARTAVEFARIVARNPLPTDDTAKLYYTLLASQPAPKLLTDFCSLDFSPDQVHLVNDTIYMLCATRYSDSRFTNSFHERKLKVPTTTRNHNTMTRLVELSLALPAE